jgi:hypothetical protein|tara:strand:+ start:3885 stop:4586 length:702 start_codon:yes stop_codon:yes gene_type:complete
MFKSLLIPGWGQVENNDLWWKTAIFAGVEAISLFSSIKLSNKAENIRRNFEQYGDNHWTLERWFNNTRLIFPTNWEKILIGTHKLSLNINGDYYFTDELNDLIETYDWNNISVIRNRDFYENIGKYDQFVGGWDDEYDNPYDNKGNWYTLQKGNVESIILTKNKNYYRNLRYDSNQLKHYSRYAITSMMFNHIISALDAAIVSNRMNNLPSIRLNYGSINKWAVGGVQITYAW